jgi:hypothetical protein
MMSADGTNRTCQKASTMSASLIGRLGSSTFRLSTTAVSMSLTGSCFSSESAPRPFHHGIRGRGGTIFGSALPSCDGRSKRTYELTSSIVPRGTSCHRWVELEFSPIAFEAAQPSCRCDLPGPLELGAVNPDAVHDHRQPTGQGHDRLLQPAVPGDLHRPGLEPRPLC